jgi:tetratricopeptide (TPR) repeat protein
MRCSHCNTEVQPGDKFCPNCGKPIDWATPVPASTKKDRRCSVCGSINDQEAIYCESCGAALPGRSASGQRQKPHKEKGESSPSKAIQFLHSWKLTLGLAAIFIVVLVFVGTSGNQDNHVHHQGDFSAHASQMLAEIEQLQKKVDENSKDAESMVLLANRLHDVRFFPRAIATYQRYLELKPSDADARVDLGICYFEMGLADETKKGEYLARAQEEMKKALTYEPQHQLAHFNLAIVFLQGGNIQESNTWFKKCVDLNPNSETGKRAQELYKQHQPLIQ